MAAIANQNGRHMVQHVLLPVNIHFHWNLFIFEFLTIYFYFFILVAILKTKSTTLSDDLFLCQVSNGSTVRFPLKHFLHLGYHGNGRHFECVQPQKLPHTTVDIPTKFHEAWWKESNFFFKSPLFCFHGNCSKACPTDSDFFGLSRSTRCGCCTYQVSSISVWRVTCYDNFCVF